MSLKNRKIVRFAQLVIEIVLVYTFLLYISPVTLPCELFVKKVLFIYFFVLESQLAPAGAAASVSDKMFFSN